MMDLRIGPSPTIRGIAVEGVGVELDYIMDGLTPNRGDCPLGINWPGISSPKWKGTEDTPGKNKKTGKILMIISRLRWQPPDLLCSTDDEREIKAITGWMQKLLQCRHSSINIVDVTTMYVKQSTLYMPLIMIC